MLLKLDLQLRDQGRSKKTMTLGTKNMPPPLTAVCHPPPYAGGGINIKREYFPTREASSGNIILMR